MMDVGNEFGLPPLDLWFQTTSLGTPTLAFREPYDERTNDARQG